MDRRSFLARSAIGSSVLAAGGPALVTAAQGCGASLPRPTLAAGETRELIGRLDRGLGAIREVPRETYLAGLPGQARPDLCAHVLKLTLEGLVVADVVRALPDDMELPDALRERLEPELPVLHRCVDTHHALLTTMPMRARSKMTRRVRQRPDVPMEVAAWIDRHASGLGMSAAGRVKLRQVATTITARMRRQSASAVIDDCVGKVERAVARSGGSIEQARARLTTALTSAIWQDVDGAGGGLSQPRESPPLLIIEHEVPPRDDGEARWSERWGSPGDSEVTIGAIMMPFGLLSCGLMLIVGLTVVIAGVVQNEEWDGTPQSRGG